MARSMRKGLEEIEESILAPYACRAASASRRLPVGDGRAYDYRTSFQRDRDRIVYSRAFRRLRQKAQAGILPAYEDHRRNRLTHTLEVVQLSRTIARALNLNEDLAEAIALGHDLGQPAFGAAGQRALDDLMSGRLDGRGGPGLGDMGGFRRSWQSLRVVDLLEKRYDHPGLNLTDPVREGLLKSGQGLEPFPREESPPDGVRYGKPPLLEAQVVILADRIAGALSDLDDALQAAVVDVARVERLKLVQELRRKLKDHYRSRAGKFIKANAIHRGLTHLLVTSAIFHGRDRLARWCRKHPFKTAEEFLACRDEIVTGREIVLSRAVEALLADLESFLSGQVHRGFEPDRVEARGRKVLLGLFAAYYSDPGLLEDHVLFRFRGIAGRPFLRDLPRSTADREIVRYYRQDPRFARILADYLAGMTDSFALNEHEKLMAMGAIPIPGAEQLRREENES
jgi:dGTPase